MVSTVNVYVFYCRKHNFRPISMRFQIIIFFFVKIQKYYVRLSLKSEQKYVRFLTILTHLLTSLIEFLPFTVEEGIQNATIHKLQKIFMSLSSFV